MGGMDVSSSSDEESNLASSVDYEKDKKQRTHSRDRMGTRISHHDMNQVMQHMRFHSNISMSQQSQNSQYSQQSRQSRQSRQSGHSQHSLGASSHRSSGSRIGRGHRDKRKSRSAL